MPLEIEEYVQRIGRTGRVGNQGIATSLFDPDEDCLLVDPIIKILASVIHFILIFFKFNSYLYILNILI